MKSSILFALLSLLFAGVNDVVFKKYSSKERSRGMYIFGIGIIWTFLQAVAINIQDISFSYDFVSIRYGLAAGILLTVSNILLLESLTHIDVSLGSTIYRLNTVGVVILSFFVLHEPLGVFKIIGVICGLIAILLLLISLSWIVGGALYAKLRENRFKITRKKIIYSIVSGILVFLTQLSE